MALAAFGADAPPRRADRNLDAESHQAITEAESRLSRPSLRAALSDVHGAFLSIS